MAIGGIPCWKCFGTGRLRYAVPPVQPNDPKSALAEWPEPEEDNCTNCLGTRFVVRLPPEATR